MAWEPGNVQIQLLHPVPKYLDPKVESWLLSKVQLLEKLMAIVGGNMGGNELMELGIKVGNGGLLLFVDNLIIFIGILFQLLPN